MPSSTTQAAYAPNEERVAVQSGDQIISIFSLNIESGEIAELLFEIEIHKNEIQFFDWLDSERVISVDAAGVIAIHNINEKSLIKEGKLETDKDYLRAALSPDKSHLFVGGTIVIDDDSDERLVRIPIDTLEVKEHMTIDLNRDMRFFGFSEKEVRIWRLEEDWDTDEVFEDVQTIDMTTEEISKVKLPGCPENDLYAENSSCDIQGDIIARICYENPVHFHDEFEYDAFLELRDLKTNSIVKRLQIYTLIYNPETDFRHHLNEESAKLLQGEVDLDNEKYREAVACGLFGAVEDIKLTADHKRVWVLFRGQLRCIDVEENKTSAFINASTTKQLRTINDIGTEFSLTLSPSGNFIAFDNPLQFFNPEKLPLFEEKSIDLGEYVTESDTVDQTIKADFVQATENLLLTMHKNRVEIYDMKSEAILLSEEIEYGNDLQFAAFSPDNKSVLLGWQGRQCVLFTDLGGENHKISLPFLHHAMVGAFLSNDLMYFINWKGSVILYDFEELHFFWGDENLEIDGETSPYPAEPFIKDRELDSDDVEFFPPFEMYDAEEMELIHIWGTTVDPNDPGTVFVTTEDSDCYHYTISKDKVTIVRSSIESSATKVHAAKGSIITQGYERENLSCYTAEENKEFECPHSIPFAMHPSGESFYVVDDRHTLSLVEMSTLEKKNLLSSEEIIVQIKATPVKDQLIVVHKSGKISLVNVMNRAEVTSYELTSSEISLQSKEAYSFS